MVMHEPPPLTSSAGWLLWKEGRPHGRALARTKDYLLIGYDMMPLRGLDQTEEVLRGKGLVALPTVVHPCPFGEQDAFAALYAGVFDPEALEFSGHVDTVAHTLWGTAYFVRSRRPHLLTPAETVAFRHWFFFPTQDGRRRTTYARLTGAVQGALERLQVRIVPVRYALVPAGQEAARE